MNIKQRRGRVHYFYREKDIEQEKKKSEENQEKHCFRNEGSERTDSAHAGKQIILRNHSSSHQAADLDCFFRRIF